jgi:uncharacterized coiled-coil protein SlyX
MLKQLNDRRVENLEYRLNQAHKVINELLGALTCPSEELRMLTRDVALSYLETIHENSKGIKEVRG